MKKMSFYMLLCGAFMVCQGVTAQQFSLEQIKALPEKKTSFFRSSLSTDINDKIQNTPFNVIAYLCSMDNTTTYKNYVLSDSEKHLFIEYYSYLPEAFKKQIQEKVLAVYFIDGFSFGGMADYTFDEKGEMFSVLYINAKVLRVSLSEWLTERDNSPFESSISKAVEVSCSSTYKGLLHVLIHEACHIYDYYNHSTPYTEVSLQESGVGKTPFVNVWDDYYQPVSKYVNKNISKISFYGFGKKIKITEAGRLIDYLNKSPFSSLYGAKNWADDFAETFTYYYLKKYFNLEYKVCYKEKGTVKKTYIPTNNPLVINRYIFNSIAD